MNPPAQLHWLENGIEQSVRWRSESGAPPPRRVVLADDTMGADAAYRLACEGTALLWRGDFHNARQLLQALARRADRKPRRPARATAAGAGAEATAPTTPAQAFHLHRQAQAQRARVLGMLIIPLAADYAVPLRRAPDFRDACTEAWDGDARTARDGAGLAARVAGRPLEGADFWRGLHVSEGTACPARPDLFVLPAHVEHQPRALLAALARGIPVIASSACGLGELPGVVTVPPGDPQALRAAISSVLAAAGLTTTETTP